MIRNSVDSSFITFIHHNLYCVYASCAVQFHSLFIFAFFNLPSIAPSAPVNLKQLRIRESRVELEWQRPDFPNGIIQEYRIYVVDTANNTTDVQRLKQFLKDQVSFKYTIDNLRKYH